MLPYPFPIPMNPCTNWKHFTSSWSRFTFQVFSTASILLNVTGNNPSPYSLAPGHTPALGFSSLHSLDLYEPGYLTSEHFGLYHHQPSLKRSSFHLPRYPLHWFLLPLLRCTNLASVLVLGPMLVLGQLCTALGWEKIFASYPMYSMRHVVFDRNSYTVPWFNTT